MVSFLDYSPLTSDQRLITAIRENAPNASLRLQVIEQIIAADLKLRDLQGDRDRAVKGLGLRTGESPSSAVNGEPRISQERKMKELVQPKSDAPSTG